MTILVSLDDWLSQVCRVTLFLSAPLEIEGIWQEINGENPMIDQSHPREGVRAIAGLYKSGYLEVRTSPLRADFVIIPAPESGATAIPFTPALEALLTATSDWMTKTSPKVVRLAFGAVLVKSETSTTESYATLAKLVPLVKFDYPRLKEVLFRVNEPTSSSVVNSIEINRISSWASFTIRQFEGFRIGTVGNAPSIGPTFDQNFTRLEVDNSTPASRSEDFDRGDIFPLLNELISFGLDTAQNGVR